MTGREIENYTKKGQLIAPFSFFGTEAEFEEIRVIPKFKWDGKRVNEGSVFYIEDTGAAYIMDSNYEWQLMTSGGDTGATNYADLTNKPSINGITLQGDKGNADLGIVKLIEAENNTTVNGYSVPELTKEDMENAFNALQGGFPCFITDATGKFTYKVKQVDTNDEDIFVCFDFCDVMVLNYKLDVNDDVTITYKEFVDGSTKLDKVTTTTTYPKTYVKLANGTNDLASYTADNYANSLILRDANGRARVADPSENQDIATKNYVDTQAQMIMDYVKAALKGE